MSRRKFEIISRITEIETIAIGKSVLKIGTRMTRKGRIRTDSICVICGLCAICVTVFVVIGVSRSCRLMCK